MSKTHSLVARQFDDLEQQAEADSLGMWVFLATEVLFFGGMFAAFMIYRSAYSDVFAQASKEMAVVLGGINTGVLLLSSLTVVLAVYAVKENDRRGLMRNLIFTILLGLTFLVLKSIEYTEHAENHLVPGIDFQYHGLDSQRAQIYFFMYYVMTGIHALHMLIGIGVMSVMLYGAYRNKYNSQYYMPIEVSGLYWHFVDIVWIFLYPMIYLIDVHK